MPQGCKSQLASNCSALVARRCGRFGSRSEMNRPGEIIPAGQRNGRQILLAGSGGSAEPPRLGNWHPKIVSSPWAGRGLGGSVDLFGCDVFGAVTVMGFLGRAAERGSCSSHFPGSFATGISSPTASRVVVPLLGPHRSLPCDGKYEVAGARAQAFIPSILKGKTEP